MRDAMAGEKRAQGNELTPIVRIQVSDFVLEPLLDQRFKGHKDFLHLRLQPQRIEPDIPREVFHEYKVVLEVIDGMN